MLDRGVLTGIAAAARRPELRARIVAAPLEGLCSSRQILGLAPGAAEAVPRLGVVLLGQGAL